MIETSVQNILTASVSTKKENKNMTAFTGDIQILLYTEEENFLSAETSIKRCSDRSHITVGTKARRIAAQSSGLVAVQSAYSVRHNDRKTGL